MLSPASHPGSRRARALTAATVALACALGVVSAVLASSPASARPEPDAIRKSSIDRGIRNLSDQLADTSSTLRDAYAALQVTNTQLPVAQANLAAAQATVGIADARNAEAAEELAVAQANEAKAEAALVATQRQMTGARQRVAGFASQIYQEQGLGQLSVAMSATSPDDFASRLAMMDTVLDIQQRTFGELSTARADQTAQESHLSALRADSAAAKVRAAQALAAATSARNRAQAAKTALDQLAARQQAQTTALTVRQVAERQQIASMQAVSARLGRILAVRARLARIAAAKAARSARLRAAANERAGRTSSLSGRGFLSAAELGQPITSEYGMRFHPILHIWRMHTGLDFGGACGTPIYAAGPGTIISAGWAGGYGNRVVIDHGLVRGVDLATTYNHMRRIVRYGGHVSRGQLIGYEGTTGLSTGCHLHFETMQNGSFVNPRTWL